MGNQKAKGPAFVRFLGPILAYLREQGDVASAADVTDAVAARSGLSSEELASLTLTGQPRIRNQIGWASFYLRRAGLLEQGAKGIWRLTDQGRTTVLEQESAFLLFKKVQAGFKRAAETEGEDEPAGLAAEVSTARTEPDAGVEEERDADLVAIDEPYNPAETRIITKPMTVEQLAKRIHFDEIDLAPMPLV